VAAPAVLQEIFDQVDRKDPIQAKHFEFWIANGTSIDAEKLEPYASGLSSRRRRTIVCSEIDGRDGLAF
jgi:hypothetical protein